MLHSPISVSCDFTTDADMAQLSMEIEKERVEYLEKSKHLAEHLQELKSEIEVLKVENKLTSMDLIYEDNVLRGENKYSTLRKPRKRKRCFARRCEPCQRRRKCRRRSVT